MSKLKKLVVSALLACAVFSLAACGGGTKEDETKNTTNEMNTTTNNVTNTTTNDEIDTDNTRDNTTRGTGIIDEIGDDMGRGMRDIADDIKR